MEVKFNNLELPDFCRVTNIKDSLLPSISQNTIKISGRPGSVDFGNEIGERRIIVDIAIIAQSSADIRGKARELANWLYYEEAKELVILNEPDKYYMAKVTGGSDIEETLHIGQGTIEFVCTDPFAYGETKVRMADQQISNGAIEIVNPNAVDMYPQIDITFRRPTSHLSLVSNDEHMYFGGMKSVDTVEVNTEPVVLEDGMSSALGWSAGIAIDDGIISGSFGSNGYSVNVANYGDIAGKTKWYGPAGIKTLSRELQDFKIETVFGLQAGQIGQLGRVEVYFLNTNNVVIGKQSLRIGNPDAPNPYAQVRVGQSNYIMETYNTYAPSVWQGWASGTMAIARRGKEWSMYYAMHDADGNHVGRVNQTWTDIKNVGTSKVAKIQIHMGTHVYCEGNVLPTIYISNIKVSELNAVPLPNKDTVPFSFQQNDVLSIDSETAEVRLNGAPFFECLDPLSKFIKLESGVNLITVRPTFNVGMVKIRYRERFL